LVSFCDAINLGMHAMQLDLFSDNRRTIRLNDAGESLRSLRLDEALAIYAGLLADAPEDPEILALQEAARSWRDRLAVYSAAPTGTGRLHEIWLALAPKTPAPLVVALRGLLIEELLKLPSPELIFTPPRFHLGTVLMSAGKLAEAERWFAKALQGGIDQRGIFLAWRGDALMSLGDAARAKDAYCAAFLEGPREVDLASLRSPMIQDLLFSLESECDEIGEMDLVAWLPVWGWLQGEFGLRLNEIAEVPATFRDALEEAGSTGISTLQRQWFNYLRYAEYLRTATRDDRELLRVRRRMRELSGFMFSRYMAKVRNLEESLNVCAPFPSAAGSGR
jgi:tetratricopeptide (TPR) repeat protein